jgi:hypothetical protein
VAYSVVEITTEAQFRRLHDLLASYFDTDVQCSPRSFYPSLGQIHRSDHVYIALNGTTPVVAALVQDDGHVSWLNGAKAHLIPASVEMFKRIYADLGSCWGFVNNDTVRHALEVATGPNGNVDGKKVWWSE